MKHSLHFFLFLVFSLVTFVGFGQRDTLANTSYDSIRTIITKTLRNKDTLRSIEITKYYRDRAIKEENHKEIAFGYGRYGFLTGINGELEVSILAMDTAIAISERYNFKELELRSHITKGMVYNTNFLISESIDSYYTALDLAYQKEDYETAYAIINTLGWIKGSLEDHEGAIKILKKGLNNVSNEDIPLSNVFTNRRELKVSFVLNIASAHFNAERIDSSIYYIDRAEELMILPNDSCLIRTSFELKANALVSKNQFIQAQDYLQRSTQYCRPLTALDSLRWSNAMGEIYLGQKKYREAAGVLRNGLKIYNVTSEEEKFMVNYYKTMAKAYKNIGLIDSANYFLEKHLNTTTASGDLRTNLTNSFRNQELKKFKKELEDLSQQKSQKENLLLYGSIGGGVVILLLVLGLIKTNKKRKENEQNFEALLAKVTAADVPKEIIDTKDEVLEALSTSEVNPETTQQILEGLKKLEDQSYFLHPACSAHNVAKRIKTNTTYLSKVINAEFGKNFSTYVNDLRINYAIVRLKQDSKFRSYTISAIAIELGYKSADSFTKYFKKDTGLLPSFYIKKLNQTA